jgi:hypothetical protein
MEIEEKALVKWKGASKSKGRVKVGLFDKPNLKIGTALITTRF